MPRLPDRRLYSAMLASLVAACSSTATTDATTPTLTVHGSAGAPPAAAAGAMASSMAAGDPASLTLGTYALWISVNEDCSSPVLVEDHGAAVVNKDFVANPVLFTGTPPAGAYKCVAIRMSDIIRFTPASSFGTCVLGTEYAGDIYREGESDWKDVDLNTVVGHGTDSVPVDDHITLFMTRNRDAVIARGMSPHQVILLASDLGVPGQSTFYWNGQGTVSSEGGSCGINPGHPEFR